MHHDRPRRLVTLLWTLASLGGALGMLAALASLGGCADAPEPAAAPHAPPRTFAATVARPAAAPRVATDLTDSLGRPVTVGCPTCHSLPDFGDPERKVGSTLSRFHVGLVTKHGDLACRACHAAPDYRDLHLADGRTLPFTEVQTLCRQCHGPQGRDFDRGAHGGMRGYWDLSRGPRERHACTTCHDPHAPAFAGMVPAKGPVDPRFGGGH